LKEIYNGKTKALYDLGEGKVRLIFKDDVTGTQDGVIDPGANEVIGKFEGKGLAALKQSAYFFALLASHGVPTHYLSADFADRSMVAKKAQWFGLEFVVRFKAYGSFIRRYGKYASTGDLLGGLVEITLKDDLRQDPLILDETLDVLGILPYSKVQEAKALVKKAAQIIHDHLQSKGVELIDIKFECGMIDDQLVIIDDISTDNMRLFQNGSAVNSQGLLAILNL
jgi:phosphoribosylaminoimidazole-succinocarboxamide synthase